MANPTMAAAGRNREMHCASVDFTWSATVAGTYVSDVMVPPGAQIVSIATVAGATVPTTGTNIRIQIGGTNVMAALALAKYDAVGEATIIDPVDGVLASLSGAIALLTTGTHDAGVTKVSVCYIV